MSLSRHAIQTLVSLVDDRLCDHPSETIRISGELRFCRNELIRELHSQELHRKEINDLKFASNFSRRAKQLRCQNQSL